jgi:cell division protein FtsW
MITNKKKLETDLSIFIGIVILLTIIGLIFIYSASSVFALEKTGLAHFFLKKQSIGLALGILAILVIQYVPIELLKKSCPFLFFISLALTALTVFSGWGQNIHGSSRWLSFAGFSFQPTEILKVSLILYVAYLLDKKKKHNSSLFHCYIQLLFILCCVSILLLKQPDFGLTVTLVTASLLLICIAGGYTRYIGFTILAAIPIVVGLIIAKSYRLKRILVFLNPWADPHGAGFQIIQSLIAIGSGGIWGVGIGQSKQKFFYLPMQHTDFIFSIIAEETGLLGSITIVSLFLLLAYFGLRIALQLKDNFCILTAVGFITVISLQAFINICVATGLAPTKGIGLPFISYGNSALICQLAMVGFIILFVRNNEATNGLIR